MLRHNFPLRYISIQCYFYCKWYLSTLSLWFSIEYTNFLCNISKLNHNFPDFCIPIRDRWEQVLSQSTLFLLSFPIYSDNADKTLLPPRCCPYGSGPIRCCWGWKNIQRYLSLWFFTWCSEIACNIREIFRSFLGCYRLFRGYREFELYLCFQLLLFFPGCPGKFGSIWWLTRTALCSNRQIRCFWRSRQYQYFLFLLLFIRFQENAQNISWPRRCSPCYSRPAQCCWWSMSCRYFPFPWLFPEFQDRADNI